MSRHRYPPSALGADYVRATLGVALTGGPLLFVDNHPAATSILGFLAALFLLYGLRTAFRHTTCFEVNEDAITRTAVSTFGPTNANLPWPRLKKVGLRYYATRRGRGDGWMQLILKSEAVTLRIESSLDGFDVVASRAAAAAQENGLEPDSTTISNFAALGIGLGEGARQPASSAL